MRRIIFLFLLACAAGVQADIDVHEFSTPEQRARYDFLIDELRCPKCQNQNLADSNAPLAKDLRDIVHQKVVAGESNEAILQFMQERYGDFVLYRPPVQTNTWLLWFGPGAALLAVLVGLVLWWRRQKQQVAGGHTLSDSEQQRLQALLSETDNASSKGRQS